VFANGLRHLVALYALGPFVADYDASVGTEHEDRVLPDALYQEPEDLLAVTQLLLVAL
jgi:hypothetical protein